VSGPRIHPTSVALIDPSARIGDGTAIWVNVQVMAGARIGRDCILGKDVFVDADVVIGDRCKIQNGVSLYRGVTLEDGVFMGPHCTTTNDLDPAAITPEGRLKGPADWTLGRTLFREGARVGAHATIICGDPVRTIGRWALVGAGALILDDVPDFALAIGHPARTVRYVCPVDLRHTVELRASAPWCTICARSLDSIVARA
jgi:acetyltransferase-like isoleucine patch superfamily enzyme